MISEAKQKLQENAGGKMTAWESGGLLEEEREQFWGDVLAFEADLSQPISSD